MYGTLLFILRNCVRNKFWTLFFILCYYTLVQVYTGRLSTALTTAARLLALQQRLPALKLLQQRCPPFRVSNNCCPPFKVSNNCCPPFSVLTTATRLVAAPATAIRLVAAPATVALILWHRLQLWLRRLVTIVCYYENIFGKMTKCGSGSATLQPVRP